MSRPDKTEAAPYYFAYIDRVTTEDVVTELERQLEEIPQFLRAVSEQQSLFRYAPEKWTMRQALSHINDTERVFAFRAFWFARGFEDPLPSFDQDVSAATSQANEYAWASHIEEFQRIRSSTVAFFRNLPADAWARGGKASGNQFTVRALAFILTGHLIHHKAILEERYLPARSD